ncbi:MAG TPA: SH3 domain-containing protein [Candidatus Omnitrophota bacterium]|nr:SH3 domain-containing protein [Candidatus Omnitrophota bacterium]
MQRFFIYPILSAAVILIQSPVFAQHSFPFLGEITENDVIVRAGQNQNFEQVSRLDKGSGVVVVAKSYSWYKIQLPADAQIFISDKYIERKGKQGLVTAKDVNVRAGADINFSIVGQLTQGDTVTILDTKPGWYKIAPVEQSYGWVKEEFVAFKSNTLPPGNPPEVVPQPKEEKAAEEKRVEEKVDKKAEGKALITIEGELAALKQPVSSDIHYQVLSKDKSVYLIRGLTFVLDDLVGLNVRIEGSLEEGNPAQTPSPVVNVSKIQLIL